MLTVLEIRPQNSHGYLDNCRGNYCDSSFIASNNFRARS